MALIKPKNPKIKGLNEVGRYAVGVQWADGHDSIYPLESLRTNCSCQLCEADGDTSAAPADSRRLVKLARMGEQAVFLHWGDGHETIYTTRYLRELCRCARCIAEPERPITGG
jgi:DUF971 family protein